MAKVFPVPVIRQNQYDAFRREIGPDLADTYDEWAKRFQESVKDSLMRGDTFVPIEVDFNAFEWFCGVTRKLPTLEALLDFAIEKNAALQKGG
jgi:hypothetical protein